MYRFLVYVFTYLLFVNLFECNNANLPEWRTCADPNCSVAISSAVALLKFHSNREKVLSFPAKAKMTVYSKSVNEKDNLWGVEINGERGYVPKNLIRESKVLYKGSLDYTVPTEFANITDDSNCSDGNCPTSNESTNEIVQPTKVEEHQISDSVESTDKVLQPTEVESGQIEQNEHTLPMSSVPSEIIPDKTVGQESTFTGGVSAEPFDANTLDKPYEVYDGTTVYYETNVDATTTQERTSELKTAVPQPLETSNQETSIDQSASVTENSIEQMSEESKSIVEEEKESDGGSGGIMQDLFSGFSPWGSGENVEENKLEKSEGEQNEEDDDEEEEDDLDEETDEGDEEDTEEVLTSNEGSEQSKDVEVNVSNIPTTETEGVTVDLPPTTETVPVQDNINSAESVIQEESYVSESKEVSSNFTNDINVVGSEEDSVLKLKSDLESADKTASVVKMSNSVYAAQEESFHSEAILDRPSFESFQKVSDVQVGEAKNEEDSNINEKMETVPEHIPTEQIPIPGDVKLQEDEISEKKSSLNEETATSTEDPTVTQSSEVFYESSEIPPLSDENVESEEMPGFFSNIINSLFGGGESQVVHGTENDKVEVTSEELKGHEWIPVEQILHDDETCKSVIGLESNCQDAPNRQHISVPEINDANFDVHTMFTQSTSYQFLVCLIITAITVLVFSLGHYLIEKRRQDGPLIARINSLEQELLVSSRECSLLKDDLQNTKEVLSSTEDSSTGSGEVVLRLQKELEETKVSRSELEAQVESLQQELDTATEAGLELNRMLTEFLSQQHGSDSLMQSVEHLQKQLDNQQTTISEMNARLTTKNAENEALQLELTTANERAQTLEDELNDIKQNLNQLLREKEELTEDLTKELDILKLDTKKLTSEKDSEIERLKKSNDEFDNRIQEISNTLAIRDSEYKALQETVQELKNERGDSNLDVLFDVGHVKAELSRIQAERDVLKEKLSDEEGARNLLEDHVKSIDTEVNELRNSYKEAEKEKVEAQTRLEVLSNYFKEKETQLQKELGLQEAMWVQKQGDDSTVYERMKSLQEEVDNYKSQNEILKKEILDQERGLKGQIATLEKKAHENWVAARQAERKLEESKQEAGQLRNRLTLIEKNMNNDPEGKPVVNRTTEEINGVEHTLSPLVPDSSSPLMFPPLPLDPLSNPTSMLPPGFMPPPFMPPPPGGFMPPPPPPFLPGDRRPPPLGRMSSPPLNHRFSPPSPDYEYERMSPPPPSPPIRNYRSPNFDNPERERERFRHRTPPSPSFPSRDWDETHPRSGFRPLPSQRDPRRDHKGSTLSSGHSSSDSLDKSSRHSGKV